MEGLTNRSSGEETSEALAAVLQDQARRKERREAPPPPPRDRARIAGLALVPLTVIAVWVVLAPPAVLRPPVPVPTVEEIQNGLYLEIALVAAQVLSYRDENGRLPNTLEEALTEPEMAAGFTYTVTYGDLFEIRGERHGQHAVYRSSESLTDFVATARAAVESGS